MQIKDDIRIPIELKQCPIVGTIIEFWFDTTVPHQALFGLWEQHKNDFQDYEPLQELPTTEIPQKILREDPGLKYATYYYTVNNEFQWEIGPHSMNLKIRGKYPGWEALFTEVKRFLPILQANQISNVHRFGIRYVDFFRNENILESLNMKMTMHGEAFHSNLNLRLEVPYKYNEIDFRNIIQISNQASMTPSKEATTTNGSVVDIDTILTHPSLEELEDLLVSGHELSKILFFNLLQKNFIERSLEPVWGESE